MSHVVDISSFLGYRIRQVEVGAIITDPTGREPSVTVDDNTVAVRRGTMFVTEKVFNRLRYLVPEKQL